MTAVPNFRQVSLVFDPSCNDAACHVVFLACADDSPFSLHVVFCTADIQDQHALILVRGAKPAPTTGASPPAPAPQSASQPSTTPSGTTAEPAPAPAPGAAPAGGAAANPFAAMFGMPGGMPMFGMPGMAGGAMPSLEQMQAELMNNPGEK